MNFYNDNDKQLSNTSLKDAPYALALGIGGI